LTVSERRQKDRRASPRGPRSADQSWFGASAPGPDSEAHETQWGAESSLGADSSGSSASQTDADSRFMGRDSSGVVRSEPTAFQRLYRVFLGARAAVGVALVVAQLIAWAFGVTPPLWVALLCALYAALALGMWWLPRWQSNSPQLRQLPQAEPSAMSRMRSPQWLATIGADIVCFTALHLVSRSSSFNYVALLVLPVLMAGVMTPRIQALATAAVVAICLLSVSWLTALGGSDAVSLLAEAGLAGIGMFIIAVLAGELASRLAREQLNSKGSLELARQQTQLNRLVIEEMQDGVLVVDRMGRVRAANPAARRLLAPSGISRPAPFQLRGVKAWEAVVRTVERAFSEAVWPEAGRDVVVDFAASGSADTALSVTQRTLRVRIRFTRRRDAKANEAPEEFCVLLLEDVRSMQARIRQEKLAAMGRVSAGIAHEIRNPLAAISQANALLAEDATTPTQQQLTRMVADNVERLKRIIEDVMEVAPGQMQEAGVIDLNALVGAVCSDWVRSGGLALGDSSVLKVDLPVEPISAVFDAEHLRRVLVNLLDNALRHGSQTPGAIHLRLFAISEQQVQLSVASDGAPIAADVERFLFEPFFSTRSRGTGLGLYICRELCERYAASIDYQQQASSASHRNEFLVVMRRQKLTDADARLRFGA
jgi:two-component system, NtrC family, sensor histidine kinase PilS